MKKGIKGTLFVLLYLGLSFIFQLLVTLVGATIAALQILPGLNLGEKADVAALTESLLLWLSEYSSQMSLIWNILLLGSLFLVLYLRKIPLKTRLGNGRLTFRNIIASLLLLSGIGVLVSFVLSLSVLAPYMEEHDTLMNSLTTGNPFFVFVAIAIVAPIVEEFTFRGMIYNELKTFMPPWLGVIISALLFGLWHGNIVQGTYAFLLGILLAAAYEKTDSFGVPVLMHILFNSLNFTPDLLWEDGTGFMTVFIGIVWFVWGWKLLRKKEA